MQLSHQRMYQKGNYSKLQVNEFFHDISILLLKSDYEDISFELTAPSILIDVEQAQTLGYILHELITNSIKYAWNNDSVSKKITLKVEEIGNILLFRYKDNGVGNGAEINDLKGTSFGVKLINAMAKRQLQGSIIWHNQSGLDVEIQFEKR